jgi:cell division protease FtsH
MVGTLGMTDSLISYAAMEEGLNDRNVVARVLSDPDGRERTERLLRDAKAAAKEQLDRNRVLVEALRDALLERDELIGDEILDVLRRAEGGPATPAPPRPVASLLAARSSGAPLWGSPDPSGRPR